MCKNCETKRVLLADFLLHMTKKSYIDMKPTLNYSQLLRNNKMQFCVVPTKFKVLVLLTFHFLKRYKSTYAIIYDKYEECKRPYQCANVSLSYPFYDSVNRPLYCGYPGFQIECNNVIPMITMSSDLYYLASKGANPHTVSLAKEIYMEDSCLENLSNTTINSTLYRYTLGDENITIFYDCPSTNMPSVNKYKYSCDSKSSNSTVYYYITRNSESSQLVHLCKRRILVAIAYYHYFSIVNLANFTHKFRYAFELEWIAENDLCDDCLESGGECGYDTKKFKFVCYCPDRPYDIKCNSNGKGSIFHNVYKAAGVILGCIITGLGILAVPAFYYKRRHSKDNQDIDAFLKKHGPIPTKRYTYRSLQKITNSFKDKLGEGGYGIVYKGKLPNAQLVAVKLLKESKGNAEEFINEVTSIARTNHVNVVTLLGFCFEGQRRALLYDFMPNGSLEKFIYAKNSNQSLDLDELFKIAVGIARGLEYLHQGCNTRLVHFDIKPHNILLDENLCPKISDFGLAKPFLKNDSIISMSGARGTVGFIAPEVYLNGFGGVSHKSDVYSYGMLVLDMVDCRNNLNAQDEHSSEQYFPQWIYKQLEETGDIDDQGLLNGNEKETLRKMVFVSLWCIQTNPSRRPPMSRVVEMLEGPLEAMQIPDTPSLFTPPISQLVSSRNATISV